MYNFIMYLLQFGVMIASLFNTKVRKMWKGECEAYRILKEKVDPNARYIWVHAASLGEFEQGRPIIEYIKEHSPEYKVLLTFFSPSGYEVRKNYEGADVICYLPIDTRFNAYRFLNLIHPEVAFFVKYEFWYHYLNILKKRHVPVYSVSSIFRPGQVFFRWYGKEYAYVLKCFTKFFVQNEESKQLLESIGIKDVLVTGDTRFDRVMQIADQSKTLQLVEAFKDDKKVFVAGSSWLPDEEIFIPYFNEHKDWKMIIAPHVIGEDHLQQIMSLLEGRKVVRYTRMMKMQPRGNGGLTDELRNALREAEVLIIDCFGLLSSIYKYGEVAYVGGGFGVGIHNVLEAAVWNMPVIFGPNHERFQEAMQLKENGGIAINDSNDFINAMKHLSNPDVLARESEHAGQYVKSNSGATEAIINDLRLAEK